MANQSLWQGTSPGTGFPTLTRNVEADVVVIGGGITGIMTALELSQAGQQVVVLEAYQVGMGTTGCSTGNLHVIPDTNLYPIRDRWGQEAAAAVVSSRSSALASIESLVARYQLSCGFSRRPHYLFAQNEKQSALLVKERDAALEAGLQAAMVFDVPLPFPTREALRIEHQAQFHPLLFIRELAEKIASPGCRIFENSRVTDIDDARKIVKTPQGRVHAAKIVMATHTPKGFNVLQTELGPYREYGLAARLLDDRYPDGIFWSMEEPSHSLRSYEIEGRKYLIVIGEEHKTGQQKQDVDYYRRVEDYTRSLFNVDTIDYRWSAQNYRPADELPYIGRSVGSPAVYVATGYGTNGLLYGPLAASIIADDLAGRENRWADLYAARRFSPAQGAFVFVKENMNVAKQYIKDYVVPGQSENLDDLQQGEGKLVRFKGKTLAAYLDGNNRFTALSPICTHLGCIVHWNRLDESWDCPCHGSRFQPLGDVIEGPAYTPLAHKTIRRGES